IGVVVHVGERGRLGADVPAAERIGVVAADGDDPVSLDLDGDAAHRLAQVTRTEVGASLGHARSVAYPNCTDRRVNDAAKNPSMGNVTAFGPSAAAPIATTTGTKCSCVGSAMSTPGARRR